MTCNGLLNQTLLQEIFSFVGDLWKSFFAMYNKETQEFNEETNIIVQKENCDVNLNDNCDVNSNLAR